VNLRVFGASKKFDQESIQTLGECNKAGVVGPGSRRKLMKMLCGLIALTCVSLAVARDGAAYPNEGVAEFLVEKLDITTLPSEIQPEPEKGKKTFQDYGYVTRRLEDKEALLEAPHSGSQIAIRVLQQTAHGIYVCVDAEGLNRRNGRFQRIRLLERKDANVLLQSRESWKEVDGCPAIGGLDTDSQY
jgi:hypothetical protein